MIVRPKKDAIAHEGYDTPTKLFSKSKDYIVFAVFLQNGKADEYALFSDYDDDCPYGYNADQFSVIDANTPSDWVYSKPRGLFRKTQTYSYPEWALDDDYFFHLIDDCCEPEASKKALAMLQSKVEHYTKEYAIKRFGSVNAAKIYVLKNKYDEQQKLYLERGYEKPAKIDTSEVTLDTMPLSMQDITQHTEADNDQNEDC